MIAAPVSRSESGIGLPQESQGLTGAINARRDSKATAPKRETLSRRGAARFPDIPLESKNRCYTSSRFGMCGGDGMAAIVKLDGVRGCEYTVRLQRSAISGKKFDIPLP